ncbi:hypothetical protein QBC36DRAFT_192453 [Triangularia setosa]|uniref:Galactose oxidase n=1 Tax=Triangularia setosa TaxID=2587417 RepID=A0AAN7A6P7_9PEZI|nr:hypothetical protein QBC36DRAFT_192453 [Podospora setosa]
MARSGCLRSKIRWTATVLMFSTVVSAQLPYIPTTILLPPPDKKGGPVDTAYIFTPGGDDNSAEFLALNLSSLTTSALPTPPLAGAFTPTIFANGTLGIFTGDCSSQTDGSLWIWSPPSDFTSSTSSTWHPHPQPSLAPFHLGGSISFSLQLSPIISPPTLYLYGGMCPFTNLSEPIAYDSQQAFATYSNSMFRLPLSSSSSSTSQKGEYLSSPGPPIPNAGFTLTALQPSLSNRTTASGERALTQQNSWVLLGGHTQQAFINMSTAAVWSLPEETWSFIPIHENSNKKVDSRSGHTTVLSEDGTKLVIYGGWVGDVGQKAEPEVVVVDMGLGGLGDWSWLGEEVESDGGMEGRYGHGAAVLPGDVMVVYGGWGIGGDEKKRKRQDGKLKGLRFLDLKKMEWVDGYKMPESGSSKGGESGQGNGGSGNNGDGAVQDQVDESTNKTQIGLGVGLGVGFLVLFLVIGYIFYRRRRQQTRSRKDALRDLSQGINGSLPRGITSDDNDDEMLEREHGLMFPWTAASAREWYTGGGDPYSQGRKSLAYEGLRGGVRKTGASLYMPPPPPSAKNARGLYQPTNKSTSYEFAPGGGAGRSNLISPIYEADEDDEGDLGQQPRHNVGRVNPEKPQDSSEDDDPFLTPTTATTPIGGLFPPPSISSRSGGSSPERKPQQAQDPEVQNWQNDVDVTDAVLTARIGRHKSVASKTPPRLYLGHQNSVHRSPTRGPDTPAHLDERTGSNLSEASALSFIPGAERQQLRVNTVTAVTPGDPKPSSSGSGESSSSAPTFSTARSSFPALQSEGLGLLHGQATTAQQQAENTYDDGQGGYEIYSYDGYKDEEDADYVYIPGSPSKSKAPQRRSWLGSIRRVFEKGTPESSATGGSREDLNSAAGGLESGTGVDTALVQRQGTLQRRKQRQSWGGEQEGGEEWDIERAVEQRLVQVMFTVPKERLRVVNAEIEQEGEVGEVVREGDREFDVGGYYDTWDADAAGPPTPTQQNKAKLPETELLRPPQEEEGEKMDRKRESIAGSIMTTHTMGISPSTSLRQVEIKTEGVHTAEAVRYERLEVNPGVSLSPTTMTPERVMRPKKSRTKVLEMVESIESKSSRSSLKGGSSGAEEEAVEVTPKKG